MHQLVTYTAKYLVALPVLGIFYVFLKSDNRRRRELVILLIVSGILTALLVKLATSMHQDPRPFVSDGVRPYFASSTDNGFPSDHAAFSALLALVAFKYSRSVGIALMAVTVLICWARVAAGVHHLQDVVAGVLLAAAAVAISLGLIRLGKVNAGPGHRMNRRDG